MNAAMLKALGLDAVYQVLDNRVFRILLVLVVVPVAITFLFGFHQDEITFLFGLKSWRYDGILDFMRGFGVRYRGEHPDHLIISALTSVVVEKIVGNFGLIFTIAATAFFVPRMIEKGAADVLFHKPIGRLALYLSRYVSGLLFIAMFSFALVFGMYLGFLLVSGHHDPGILWAAITLTYLFGLVHGVTMLMGVVTRSTVAATLLAILFFFGNGCVHLVWVQKEQAMAFSHAEDVAATAQSAEEDGEPTEVEDHQMHPFARAMIVMLDTLHFLGPKTNDADHLTSLLQRAVEGGDAFEDKASGFTVLVVPEGTTASNAANAAPPVAGAEHLFGDAVFHAASEDGARAFTVWSRPARLVDRERAGRMRQMTERSSFAAEDLAAILTAAGETPEVQDGSIGLGARMRNDIGPLFLEISSSAVTWTADGRRKEVAFLRNIDRILAVRLTLPADLTPEELEETRHEAFANCGILNEAAESDWYEDQIGWTAPLRYNLFFSIGSSLAFALAVLLLGWWRLSRIDF